MERFRHFGSYRGREYRGARPAARSQFLRSCFNGSYVTAAAGADSNIFGADILDTALDCAFSGATSRQISNALARRSHRHARNCLGEAAPPPFRDQQIGQWAIRKLASRQVSNDKRTYVNEWSASAMVVFSSYFRKGIPIGLCLMMG
jgi:hypothetical protein